MKLFGRISNLSSLVFQVILILIAVLVFSYFDPFELLTPTKRKLKDTPIQVESIREIGELVTAEYYGEVLTSLNEVLVEESKTTIDSFNYDIDELHNDFVMAIDALADKKYGKDSIYRKFKEEYPDIDEDTLFPQYLYYIREKLRNRNYQRKESTNTLDDNQKERLIIKLAARKGSRTKNKLHEITTLEIQKVFKNVNVKQLKENLRNSRLVLLGRGWVKAGFNFDNFNERNFLYDKPRNRVIFLGLNPEILSKTINPWFIPEEGIEGFEFVVVQRKVRHNPELTKRVKKRCLEKLVKQAMDKQILVQAQKNAEEQLNGFFRLLLDDEDFNGVYFYTDNLAYSLDVIVEDNLISNEEILSVDTILNYQKSLDADTSRIKNYIEFLNTLCKIETEIYNIPINLNSKSALLFSVAHQMMMDIQGVDSVSVSKRLNVIHPNDSLWVRALNKGKTFEEAIKTHQDEFEADLEIIMSRLKLSYKENIVNDNSVKDKTAITFQP